MKIRDKHDNGKTISNFRRLSECLNDAYTSKEEISELLENAMPFIIKYTNKKNIFKTYSIRLRNTSDITPEYPKLKHEIKESCNNIESTIYRLSNKNDTKHINEYGTFIDDDDYKSEEYYYEPFTWKEGQDADFAASIGEEEYEILIDELMGYEQEYEQKNGNRDLSTITVSYDTEYGTECSADTDYYLDFIEYVDERNRDLADMLRLDFDDFIETIIER